MHPPRRWPAALLLTALLIAGCVDPNAGGAGNGSGYTNEATDYSVPSQVQLKRPPFHQATPLEVPGAHTLRTTELKDLLASRRNAVVIDVLDQAGPSVPGAHWLPSGGYAGNFRDAIQQSLASRLAAATGGDKTAPIVTLCHSSMCWLSYNTALRAVALGYQNVYWYRGGREAWTTAGLPTAWTKDPW